MPYDEKVVDHFENPKNVGTLDKEDENVGTGLVGAPACGDVMRLQVRIEEEYKVKTDHGKEYIIPSLDLLPKNDGVNRNLEIMIGDAIKLWKDDFTQYITEVEEKAIIKDARFKTFGCGSAIASSSYVTEMVKGKSVDYAENIKNSEIVEELSLPPVKVHCSILAEDAIKSAIKDWRKKKKRS